jgi:hypothetical protein
VAKIDRANVVQPQHVIGMTMRNQQRIQTIHLFPQCLLAKIGGNIHYQTLSVVFDHQTSSQSFVAWIIRLTNLAFTTDHWNAD